ncbi:MAG: 6-carboxytetrahydropterin synthase QueD [Acidobacteria bacterium]|nr:6-carboxytetrahydropterin synthase QueD [Acidobacteriota bacterium]
MIVTCRFQFEAGHRLPEHPGACRRPHGHGYKLHVSVRAAVEPRTGLAIDFHDLERVVRERVLPELDHRDLNEILENPTAENIAAWVWGRLRESLPGLHEVRLEETEDCSITYRGE